jgi:hypothetical protein
MLGRRTGSSHGKTYFTRLQERPQALFKLPDPVDAGHKEKPVYGPLKAQSELVNVLAHAVVGVKHEAFQPVGAIVVQLEILASGV